jgi:ketosteroid isomerase-like protein
MGHLEQENAFIAAVNAQQWDAVANFLADDMTWTGAASGPLGKQGFLVVQRAWFAAAPDYHVTLSNVREQGDTISGTTSVTGTQTKPLSLPNLPTLPATSKRFAVTWPNTSSTWRGDKIIAIDLGQPSTPGIGEQLGVQMPG